MESADVCWPENFLDVGGQSFEWVYKNRAVFVEFTREKMENPSGMFLKWRNYVHEKDKESDVLPNATDRQADVEGAAPDRRESGAEVRQATRPCSAEKGNETGTRS